MKCSVEYAKKVTPKKPSAQNETVIINKLLQAAWVEVSHCTPDGTTPHRLSRPAARRGEAGDPQAAVRHPSSRCWHMPIKRVELGMCRRSHPAHQGQGSTADRAAACHTRRAAAVLRRLSHLHAEHHDCACGPILPSRLHCVNRSWSTCSGNGSTSSAASSTPTRPRPAMCGAYRCRLLPVSCSSCWRNVRQSLAGGKPTGSVFGMTNRAITLSFTRIKKRAGTEFRFHDLRHEAISRFFEMEMSPIEVASSAATAPSNN